MLKQPCLYSNLYHCFKSTTSMLNFKEMEEFLLNKKQKGTLEKFMIEHDQTQERELISLIACICMYRTVAKMNIIA